MRNESLVALGLLLAGAGLALAQDSSTLPPPAPTGPGSGGPPAFAPSAPPTPVSYASPIPSTEAAPLPAPSGPAAPAPYPANPQPLATVPPEPVVMPAYWTRVARGTDASCAQMWISTEYLLWWVKNGPLPFPLVTTGDPSDAVPGALGQPGTQPLYGGHGIDYGALSGVRLDVGGWLDQERLFGAEANAFLLERKSVGFGAASDPNGNPPLYVPAFFADVGQPGSFPIADPVAGYNGAVAVFSRTSLWGSELNGLVDILRTHALDVDLIMGFRYLDLDENLAIDATTTDFVNQIDYAFQDQFRTRNQFYGGQLGTRLGWHGDRGSLDLVGKVALGSTHEEVEINGFSTASSGGSTSTFAGGFFTQPTNIGRQSQDRFAVIPQAQLKAGYQIASGVRAYIGYDFLYWNQVVRPGSQIDGSVNSTQVVGGTLAGPARPEPLFERTDFWAQGIDFGLQFCW